MEIKGYEYTEYPTGGIRRRKDREKQQKISHYSSIDPKLLVTLGWDYRGWYSRRYVKNSGRSKQRMPKLMSGTRRGLATAMIDGGETGIWCLNTPYIKRGCELLHVNRACSSFRNESSSWAVTRRTQPVNSH